MSLAEVLSKAARSDGGIGAANWNGGPLCGFRNKIINGDFDVWQRAVSFPGLAASNVYTADRWLFNASGGAANVSRQSFTSGQTDVPGNPKYFLRFDATTGNDYLNLAQRVEGVQTLAGKLVTVTFWAKGINPGGGKMYLQVNQVFGTGGSATVVAHVGEFTLTGEWQKITQTFTLPSLAGQTIGTADHVALFIGQGADVSTAAWTLDIAHVSLVEGEATREDDPFSPRHIQQEWALCERYYQQGIWGYCGVRGTAIDGANYLHPFRTNMRATPTLTLEAYGLSDVNLATITAYYLGSAHLGIHAKPTVLTDPVRAYRIFKADAEL